MRLKELIKQKEDDLNRIIETSNYSILKLEKIINEQKGTILQMNDLLKQKDEELKNIIKKQHEINSKSNLNQIKETNIYDIINDSCSLINNNQTTAEIIKNRLNLVSNTNANIISLDYDKDTSESLNKIGNMKKLLL